MKSQLKITYILCVDLTDYRHRQCLWCFGICEYLQLSIFLFIKHIINRNYVHEIIMKNFASLNILAAEICSMLIQMLYFCMPIYIKTITTLLINKNSFTKKLSKIF